LISTSATLPVDVCDAGANNPVAEETVIRIATLLFLLITIWQIIRKKLGD
jgi:hypothetical protein